MDEVEEQHAENSRLRQRVADLEAQVRAFEINGAPVDAMEERRNVVVYINTMAGRRHELGDDAAVEILSDLSVDIRDGAHIPVKKEPGAR